MIVDDADSDDEAASHRLGRHQQMRMMNDGLLLQCRLCWRMVVAYGWHSFASRC